MDVNGKLIVKGAVNDPVVSGIADSSTPGNQSGTESKGVLKFSNGLKIQWDTINQNGNATSEHTLPEAYTEDHYIVIASWNDRSGASETESTLQSYVPTTNKLSAIRVKSADDNTKAINYISIGKDAV